MGELPDWAELRAAGRALKDSALRDLARHSSSSSRRRSSPPAARCTGRSDGSEACAIVAGIARSHGVDEVVKVKSIATDEIKLNEALAGVRRARGGDRPGRADHPARRRRPVAHPRAGDPQEPGRDPRAVRARARPARPDRRAGGARRGRAGAPAAQVPRRAHGDLGRELRGGRDGHGLRVRVRGQRAHVHDAARGARDRDGHREARARLAGHGGVPAAAAALVHRRAHEPVHVVLDRRAAGRRAAGVPPRAARQRPHRRARRPGRAPGAALHPLLGLPERLPGLLAHRRPRLRVGLSRADRGDPHAAAAGARGGPLAAVRVEPVRGLLRGLPGRDRHPAGAGAPARAGGGLRAGVEARKRQQ